MHGRDYCGKRYSSAEELLVHLKTHTNLSVSSELAGPGAGAGAAYAGLLSQSLMRGGATQLLPSALSLQVTDDIAQMATLTLLMALMGNRF